MEKNIKDILDDYVKRSSKHDNQKTSILESIKSFTGIELNHKDIEIEKSCAILQISSVLKKEIKSKSPHILEDLEEKGIPITIIV